MDEPAELVERRQQVCLQGGPELDETRGALVDHEPVPSRIARGLLVLTPRGRHVGDVLKILLPAPRSCRRSLSTLRDVLRRDVGIAPVDLIACAVSAATWRTCRRRRRSCLGLARHRAPPVRRAIAASEPPTGDDRTAYATTEPRATHVSRPAVDG